MVNVENIISTRNLDDALCWQENMTLTSTMTTMTPHLNSDLSSQQLDCFIFRAETRNCL